MNRFIKLLIILLSIGFPALSAGEGSSESIMRDSLSSNDQEFPIKAVTLYTAGLAQIVHETEVEGNQVLVFPVEHKDLNDILKSLTVEDLDGGIVDSVNFTSENPLSATLSELRVNPSGSPGIIEFLKRTQGEEISVVTDKGSFSGRIFSVEESSNAEGSRRINLNLMNQDGLSTVNILELRNLSFKDSLLQEELLDALGDIAQARVKTSRMLKISLKGTGTRTVRLSYIKAVPLWKTSYRIIVDEENNPRLEGWALVQNTGNEDWTDVKLSFVAGQPNAFIMDMATPRYVYRETVDIASASPIGAVEYDSGVVPNRSSSQLSSKSSAPLVMYEESELMDDSYYGGNESYAPAPIVSQAGGERIGNFYRYTVNSPVTVEALSSAMIPILSSPDAGSSLVLYDPAQGGIVFKALRLENKSDAHWAAGPVSVSEGRSYAGDALIPDMIPGSNRYISYALHGSVNVQKIQEPQPQRIVSLKISDGIMHRQDRMERKTEYYIQGEEEELILIHPKETGWNLTEHPEINEETSSDYRFTLKDWGDEPVIVSEEYLRSSEYRLSNFGLTDFSYYLEWADVTPEMKNALERMADFKEAELRIKEESAALTARIGRLERDQSRVRDNMAVLEYDSDLFKKYSGQLEAQEKDIQDLNRQVEEKEQELLKARSDLARFIASLELN
jgi:hypothetical protein